jgi:uncharacterized protein YndB with AHSA1/START domain
MVEIELRQYIRATPQRVWDVISDLSGQERWMEDVHRLKMVSEVRTGAGTTLDVQTKLFGLPFIHDVMEIVTWREPHEIGVVHRGAFTGTASFLLYEPAGGGTVFVWREQFQPPLGPLGKLGFVVLVRDHLKRVWGRSMANVRDLAEAKT